MENVHPYEKRFKALDSEFENWKGALTEMKTYIDPGRGLFDNDRSSIGERFDHETLLDSHASLARDTLASGLQTGASDPSRPWFDLTMDDFFLNAFPNVKIWLDDSRDRMLHVMNKSNIYEVLHSCYKELGQFSTGCFLLLSDPDDVIRGRSFTCGEYRLGVDARGRVNAFGREFDMTVEQMVQQFGDDVSDQVQADWDAGNIDKLYRVRHLIEENKNKNGKMIDFENMAFRSVYWELASKKINAKRGFERFPVIAPRWETVTTEMTYGYGPSWQALGDVKELQVTHQDMLVVQEKLGDPPLQKDSSVQGNIANIPGGVTTTSATTPNAGVRPLYQVDPHLESFQLSIDRIHRKIDRFFFADLFLMINSLDNLGANPQRTAFEIAERKSEKMMMLGPVLHKLNEELHAPLIENIFYIMAEGGLLLDPPEELIRYGGEVKIRYNSILAQAQRSLGIGQIERMLGFVGNASQLYPEAKVYLNIGETIKEVADLEGVPAKLIPSDEEVEESIEAMNRQQQMAQAAEMANSAADTTKKLADAKTGDQSALTGITG